MIVKNIPNSRENTQMWLEFLTALNMHHTDIPTIVLNEQDAQWNVHNVLDAWLNGRGSEPKTWGTLLKAMRERGTPFLRELALGAADVYLSKPSYALVLCCVLSFTSSHFLTTGKLASLRLPFDVCCVCWQSFSPTIAAQCSESPDSQKC